MYLASNIHLPNYMCIPKVLLWFYIIQPHRAIVNLTFVNVYCSIIVKWFIGLYICISAVHLDLTNYIYGLCSFQTLDFTNYI